VSVLFSAIGDADIINPSADGFCIAVSQQLEIGSSMILFVLAWASTCSSSMVAAKWYQFAPSSARI
jgi:hypothetical protein